MSYPDWLLNAATSGAFALFASFAGAWAAFKLQRVHERKAELQKEADSYQRLYKILHDQLIALETWGSGRPAITNKVVLDLDHGELYRLLSRRTYGLIRDIILAREGYVLVIQDPDKADPSEINRLKTLTGSVVRGLEDMIEILDGAN